MNLISCRAHHSFLEKLRGGSTPLEIEAGRYVGTPEQRICKLCHQDVEDEAHFILQCHALSAERQFLQNYLQMN